MAALAAEHLPNPSSAQREPSMEEILASIRRIIEDSDSKADTPYEAPANTAGTPHRAANTQTSEPAQSRTSIEVVRAELRAPEIAVAPASEKPAVEIKPAAPQAASRPLADIAPARAEAPPAKPAAAAPVAAAPVVDNARSSIISEVAGRQVAAAFGELTDAFAATRRRSFDEIAEEMMRPMLQDWLDNNLPTLVEKLVREEIERIARG